MATFNFTNGNIELCPKISTADDLTLAGNQKKPVICVTASAASKSVVLGLGEGETMFVINNGGTNAFTVKNLSGDTGTSVGAGKVALVVASKTADATLIYVLN